MKTGTKIILIVFIVFITGIFIWALFTPKQETSERIHKILKEQEDKADLAFVDVTFEEVVAGIKYWELTAQKAMLNKSTGIATLKDARGTFFSKGKAVLLFESPAALWDQKKKEILLDKPLGYDITLKDKIPAFKKSHLSIFNLPELYEKAGLWFKANNLSWKLASQKLVCIGGILLNKGDLAGYAEELKGDVAFERVVLEGNPKMLIMPENITPVTLEAQAFEILSASDIVLARGNPKISWGDAKVTADEIKYKQKDSVLMLDGGVEISYKDIQAWGKKAEYFPQLGTVILKGQASAVQGDNKLSGESVQVSLKDHKISVVGKGKVVISEEEIK